MVSNNITPEVDSDSAEWGGLYRAAGVCILITVAFVQIDIALSFTGGDLPVGEVGPVEWFAHLHEDWFLGLRNLGLFNVINTTLTIPLYLALFWMHRKVSLPFAALALILYVFSAAVYDANNRALSILALSHQYAAAATEAQKALIEAAGVVTLAQAEDFTPGSFLGLFLSGAASLMMMVVLLRGKIFARWVALIGLTGTALLLIFTVCATFLPGIFDLAMILALLGGLMMLAWNIRMGIEMFRRSRGSAHDAARRGSPARLVDSAGLR